MTLPIHSECGCNWSDLKATIEQVGDPRPMDLMLEQSRLEGDEYDVRKFNGLVAVYCDTLQEVLTDSLCPFHYGLMFPSGGDDSS